MAERIIAIAGRKGSGKDLAGNILLSILNLRVNCWKRFKFAAALKQIAAILLGDPDFVEKWESDPEFRDAQIRGTFFGGKTATNRKFLEFIGNNLFRNHFNKDIWVWVLDRAIAYYNGGAIITDLRYPNEAEYLKDCGALIIKLEREGEKSSAESESYIDQIEADYTIDNNGSFEDLEHSLIKILEKEVLNGEAKNPVHRPHPEGAV